MTPDRGTGLPTFLVVGAQKSATTTLHHHLRGHPEIEMASEKEPFYFTGLSGLDASAYGRLWSDPAVRVRGEASTQYTMHPAFTGVPERALAAVPDLRIVYVLRHPIERMVSAWVHLASRSPRTAPIGVALLHDLSLLVPSMYALQLEQWLRVVPEDRVLVLRYEDVTRDAAGQLARVFAFLGVDPAHPVDAGVRTNTAAERRLRLARRSPAHGLRRSRSFTAADTTVPADVRDHLRTLLVPDLVRLEAMLGPGWGWDLL